MTGFSTDYVNQIAINLRDRYRSGFPILKELVQNADDAGARNLVFGYHPGHGDSADHMLLRGPALWVLNDGAFKPSDRRAIRSFGLNAKAGDSGAIGKFGLGMKSVFHLCESFLYVARSGGELVHDVLNPWKTEDSDCADMHLQWEKVTRRDVECIALVALAQPEVSQAADWFLLWVPLRQRSHIPRGTDRPFAAIIERYPGENPDEDLDFFSDPRTDQRIGAMLPLLKRLERVRFAGASMRQPFTVTLSVQPAGQRLDHNTDACRIHGVVQDDRPRAEHMHFLVRQRVAAEAEPFVALRAARNWPTSMVITESGSREPRPDKAIAEAALMFAHANSRSGRIILQWAVFLPAEEQRFSYEALIPETSREYRIVLHGQFFVDAGRRGIADMESLDRPREPLSPGELSQQALIRQWNQALAQELVLPEFLPTLAEYVKTIGLKDDETSKLTAAIAQCAAVGDAGSRVEFFPTFRSFMCKRHSWVRRLLRTGARWELVESNAERLLAIPAPPARDPERPWRVFPGLGLLEDYVLIDESAPRLAGAMATWAPELLLKVLTGLDPQILKSETDLGYLADFLAQERLRYMQAGEVQDELVVQLRGLLMGAQLSEVRRHRKTFKRIAALLSEDRVFALGSADLGAKGAIPERLFRKILASPTRALPLPGDLAPDRGDAKPNQADLVAWLKALTRGESTGVSEEDSTPSQLLDAAERIIKAAGDDAEQVALLRSCAQLKVLRAMRGADGEVEGVSLTDLVEAHARGRLFKVSDPNRRLGFVPKLSQALPSLGALVVRSGVAAYVEAVSDSSVGRVPSTESVEAILRCAGAEDTPPELGSESQRAELLTLVATAQLNDPKVVRGVRYLLHGSADHYLSTDALWKDPVGQHSPWVRLWRMIDGSPWRVLADQLCGSIPDKCAQLLNVRAVDEASVLNRLRACSDFSRVDAAAFSADEIDLLLGRVADEHPWRRLPLHRDTAGRTGPAEGDCFLGGDPPLPEAIASEIRFIQPSADEDHLKRQRRWIPQWDATTAAARVLNSQAPGRHWRYLMDLLASSSTLRSKPPEAWTEMPWLPLQSGGFISIGSLIRLDNLDAEIRDLARQCAYAYASPADLSSELQSHPAFTALLDQVSKGEAALPVLGQLMSDANLSVGRIVKSSYGELQQYISTLVAIEALPAWKLLERAAVALLDPERQAKG
ncbi:MAG: sacsin N-terminal ATP-binding-like domain-containing protein, partial [Casimicrobiaceae bacterium]